MSSIAEIVAAHVEANKTELPVFDGTTQRLQGMLQDSEVDVNEVAKLVTSDPVLVSALLRAANSTFFGGLEKVTSVQEALVRLGAKQVGNLVMLITQKKSYEIRDAALRPMVTQLWKHAVATAVGSQWLAQKLKRSDIANEAFVAGLLHDIGKLFLLRVVDDMKATNPKFQPEEALVRELLASMHAEQGAALLRNWNIPEVYAEVIARHHEMDFDDEDTLQIVVRLVDQACNKLGLGLEPDPECNVAASAEAQVLRVSDVLAAELEIKLEDALSLS